MRIANPLRSCASPSMSYCCLRIPSVKVAQHLLVPYGIFPKPGPETRLTANVLPWLCSVLGLLGIGIVSVGGFGKLKRHKRGSNSIRGARRNYKFPDRASTI